MLWIPELKLLRKNAASFPLPLFKGVNELMGFEKSLHSDLERGFRCPFHVMRMTGNIGSGPLTYTILLQFSSLRDPATQSQG